MPSREEVSAVLNKFAYDHKFQAKVRHSKREEAVDAILALFDKKSSKKDSEEEASSDDSANAA